MSFHKSNEEHYFQVNLNIAWVTAVRRVYFRLFTIRRKCISVSDGVAGVLGLPIMTRTNSGITVGNADGGLDCIHRKIDELGRS